MVSETVPAVVPVHHEVHKSRRRVPGTQRAPELHSGPSGPYIGRFVYGGLDGVVTTLAVGGGVAGAALSSGVLLVREFANLLADGLSTAVDAYLSSKREQEYYEREYKTESWEIENFPEGERRVVRDLLRFRLRRTGCQEPRRDPHTNARILGQGDDD